MKVFVKNVPVGTTVTDGMKTEMFTMTMADYSGDFIDVEIMPDGWCKGLKVGFTWHKDWLEFNPCQDIQTDYNENKLTFKQKLVYHLKIKKNSLVWNNNERSEQWHGEVSMIDEILKDIHNDELWN